MVGMFEWDCHVIGAAEGGEIADILGYRSGISKRN